VEIYIYWFVLALVLLGVELATGTFYMLVISIALAVGGLIALAGLGLAFQLSVAGVVGVVGTVLLRRSRITEKPGKNGSQSLDIGQPVQVESWREDGTARVSYRGAQWDAVPESPDMPRSHTLYIKDVRGSKLVLTHQKP
jgi:membrane protein implicated in regulation of membrane protease activity